MPGVLLAVQLAEDVQRAVAGVDVEHSVHVGAPVDGVPAEEGRGGRSQEEPVATAWHIKADRTSWFLVGEDQKLDSEPICQLKTLVL